MTSVPPFDLPPDILAELEALRDAFRADATGLVEALAEDWARAARAPSAEALRGLVRQAHSLAGTAGSFALADLGARARDVEVFLDGLVRTDPASLAPGLPLLAALREAARPARRPGLSA